MLAVAVVGLLPTLAVRTHPQLVRVKILDPKGFETTWSDGSITSLAPDGPKPSLNRGEPWAFGFLRRGKWFDGPRTSYTWHSSCLC
jgi:hypothetical protein